MRDLISRQAAIDALGEEPMVWTDSDYMIGQRNQWNSDKLAIETVPSAQRWIPVSERLPEVGRNVLLSVGKGLYTAEGELKHDGTWVQYRWSANLENVDAWAEMPEPWRGEEG